MKDAKRALRRELSARIQQIPAHTRAYFAHRAAGFALRAPALSHAKLVLSYRALADEIDADGLSLALAARGVRLAFPCVDAHGSLTLFEVVTREVFASAAWTRDHFGIRVPHSDSPLVRTIDAVQLDALIVPLRAFDASGARLGRGKGFYDALIAQLRPDARAATLGFAFETQLVSAVPLASHDAHVAWMATERRLLRTKRPRELAVRNADDTPGERSENPA